MHGEWVVKGKDGKPVTLETIRGTVTAVGSSRVTVKAEDGFTETFATNSDTKVRGGADSLGDVKVGAKGARGRRQVRKHRHRPRGPGPQVATPVLASGAGQAAVRVLRRTRRARSPRGVGPFRR